MAEKEKTSTEGHHGCAFTLPEEAKTVLQVKSVFLECFFLSLFFLMQQNEVMYQGA